MCFGCMASRCLSNSQKKNKKIIPPGYNKLGTCLYISYKTDSQNNVVCYDMSFRDVTCQFDRRRELCAIVHVRCRTHSKMDHHIVTMV